MANDIMLDGGKAGGILIENSWRGSGWSSAVIGIGLNVAMPLSQRRAALAHQASVAESTCT